MTRKVTAGLGAAAIALALVGCGSDDDGGDSGSDGGLTKVKVVLPWLIQGESAGHFVAVEKGYYEDAGLDVEIVPGGPDVAGTKLLASGSVDFAITGATSVLTSRAQGMPVVSVFSGNQEDGMMFLCKKDSGIDGWEDLAGRSVGAWIGASDVALYYGLDLAGVDRDDVSVVPQKFSMAEFLEQKVDCASAMVWNEYHVVLDSGVPEEDLTILRISDFDRFLPGDGLVVTEETLAERPEIVQAFADATMRGWQDAFADPEMAADATLAFAPDLDRDAQVTQVKEVYNLMVTGAAAAEGRMGAISLDSFEATQEALLGAGAVEDEQDLAAAFTDEIWMNIPAEYAALPDGVQ